MSNVNRRQFSRLMVKGVTAVPIGMLVAPLPSQAADTPMVDLESPTAKALKYVVESEFEDKNCANCALFVTAESKEAGACAVFPAALVAATAYCTSWTPKPS